VQERDILSPVFLENNYPQVIPAIAGTLKNEKGPLLQ